MAQVFLHTWDKANAEPVNEGRKFLRLPVVGEYLTKEPTGPWYEVTLVVHCPFGGTYAAEVLRSEGRPQQGVEGEGLVAARQVHR
jgi:hypothetical protein